MLLICYSTSFILHQQKVGSALSFSLKTMVNFLKHDLPIKENVKIIKWILKLYLKSKIKWNKIFDLENTNIFSKNISYFIYIVFALRISWSIGGLFLKTKIGTVVLQWNLKSLLKIKKTFNMKLIIKVSASNLFIVSQMHA